MNKKIFFSILVGLIVLPGFAYGINIVIEGFRVGSERKLIDAHNECRKVKSTSGLSYFVPTKTASEWSLFRSNKPTDVNLNSCGYIVDCSCVTNSSQTCISVTGGPYYFGGFVSSCNESNQYTVGPQYPVAPPQVNLPAPPLIFPQLVLEALGNRYIAGGKSYNKFTHPLIDFEFLGPLDGTSFGGLVFGVTGYEYPSNVTNDGILCQTSTTTAFLRYTGTITTAQNTIGIGGFPNGDGLSGCNGQSWGSGGCGGAPSTVIVSNTQNYSCY